MIITAFRNVSLSLNPDGSKDSKLKIKDLPGITVGDYTAPPTPISIPNDDDIIKVKGRQLLYSAREKGIDILEENKNNVTIDSSNDIDIQFNYETNSSFDSKDIEDNKGDLNIV